MPQPAGEAHGHAGVNLAFIVDVFLSSTFEDLKKYTDAVYERLNKHEMFRCIHQRDFGARDATAVNYCRERVLKAELYVGVFGMRRGWEPKGDSKKRSITEMEHDWAREFGKPRFLYVTPPSFSVPGDKPEPIVMHRRQLAFRKKVMGEGERVVSQSGFGSPELLAAEIESKLVLHVATSNLIKMFRSEPLAQSPVSSDEQRPAIVAAVERLVVDDDVDLLALAKNPNEVNLIGLERKLTERAERHQAEGQKALETSAEYWRHIGALAFLHNTQKALAAYEKAVVLDSLEPEGWRYLGELQYRLGDYDNAGKSFDRVLALGRSTDDVKTQAIGSIGLGWISMDRDDLPKAEELISNAVRLAKVANWQEGTARAYVNLGIIHLNRGDLDTAEKMYLESLKLDEEQGNKEGMARAYGNLGIIHFKRDNLDRSEEMHLKSLELEEELGRKDGAASSYTSLGAIHYSRGDLDKAEVMYRKSLTLSQEVGSRQGTAATNYNLGLIYQRKGDKAAMCDFWRKGRNLYREMGLLNKVAEVEEWLKLNKCADS